MQYTQDLIFADTLVSLENVIPFCRVCVYSKQLRFIYLFLSQGMLSSLRQFTPGRYLASCLCLSEVIDRFFSWTKAHKESLHTNVHRNAFLFRQLHHWTKASNTPALIWHTSLSQLFKVEYPRFQNRRRLKRKTMTVNRSYEVTKFNQRLLWATRGFRRYTIIRGQFIVTDEALQQE